MIFIKTKIKEKDFNTIKNNLDTLLSKGLITQEDYNNEINSYEISKINFQQVISFVGVILFIIGAGLFIFEYWNEIQAPTKIVVSILASCILIFLSYISQKSYKKIGDLLLIINVVINILTIVLIQSEYSIFNDNNYIYVGLLIAIVMIPTVKYLNSKFSYIMILVAMMSTTNLLPYWIDDNFNIYKDFILCYGIYLLLFSFIIYYIEKQSNTLKDYKIGIFFRASILLYSLFRSLLLFFSEYEKEHYCFLIFLIIGIVIFALNYKNGKVIYKTIGLIVIAIFGYILADEYYLEALLNIDSDSSTILSLKYLISLVYFVFFIYNASKGSSLSLFIAINLIFKYTNLSPFAFILLGSVFLIGSFLIEKNKKDKKNKKEIDMYEFKK